MPASTVFMRMRLLVFGLIRLKRTVSTSLVVGQGDRTGHKGKAQVPFPARSRSHSNPSTAPGPPPVPWIQWLSGKFVAAQLGGADISISVY